MGDVVPAAQTRQLELLTSAQVTASIAAALPVVSTLQNDRQGNVREVECAVDLGQGPGIAEESWDRHWRQMLHTYTLIS